ncbi:MAG: hypothetical protein AB8B55_23330 [Mariniblastus sp.]
MFAKTSLGLLVAILFTGSLIGQESFRFDSAHNRATQQFNAPMDASQLAQWTEARSESHESALKRRELRNRIQIATQQLKAADSDSRAEAKKQLQDALSEEYDSLLSDYDKNLQRLADQLAEMQDKLDKRRAAKEDMIKLRMQVLEAEADDLGWPGQSSRILTTPSTFGIRTPFPNSSNLNLSGRSSNATLRSNAPNTTKAPTTTIRSSK